MVSVPLFSVALGLSPAETSLAVSSLLALTPSLSPCCTFVPAESPLLSAHLLLRVPAPEIVPSYGGPHGFKLFLPKKRAPCSCAHVILLHRG